ncbi:MAG: energy-coupled thiamine transporter ThiT [Lysinibacillus sp.]
MNNKKLLMLVEIAIFAGLGLVLDKLAFSMPQGGSVSFAMLPIVLMAIRWGFGAGLTTGLLIGILQMMFGAYVLHWVQALFDYGIAFSIVGLAAIVRHTVLQSAQKQNKKQIVIWIVIGVVVGGFGRYVAHTIAGAVFFAEYAGTQNPWIYSLGYNATYMVPAIILTAIAAALLFTSAPKLIQAKQL